MQSSKQDVTCESHALYHVTSCDQSQLTQYFSMSAGMHTDRNRNDCFYILYGCKSNQCKKK
ncbi:unnamed protein product, partial [Staurois parvus]